MPTYVAEFLLGRYCSSTNETEIQEGLEIVQRQLESRTVRAGEEELFKARAKEHGRVKLIDLVRARLDQQNDCFLAELPSIRQNAVRITDSLVKEHERMLTGGFYAEVDLVYDPLIAEEWFQTGTRDEDNDRNKNGVIDSIDDTLDLVSELTRKGYRPFHDIQYLEIKDGHHHPDTWAEATPSFLSWAVGHR